ncbi:MAG: dockerin type I repeat-containing protein, partial [Ruminococcus sp.]|nr:dockerin type I repeat-containing protein [Ruminococcus sp.]
PMTKYKDNIYKASFPKEYDMCIFNQNGQTGNLKIPGNDYIYDNNSWSAYADAEKPTTQAPTQAPTTIPVVGSVLVGDADQSGSINIVDATEIQKHIAEMITLSGKALKAADANGDGAVNIKDVTAIQYYAAGNTSQAGNCGKKM